jgi:acetylornithine deacetylase
MPCLSHYGYIETQMTTHGRRMHASLADRGHNPIQAMLRLLLEISQYLETERPEIVYNLRDLSSSRSGFAVPERCDAWLDIHLPPHAPAGELVFELEELLARASRDNTGFDGTLRFVTIHGGYEIPEKGLFLESLKNIYGQHSLPWTIQPFRSHSDANLLWEAGMKPILLGPGQLELAHIPDESVSFSQVCLASELYLDLLLSLSP